MKKLFPILAALALFASACQAGGSQAQPTAPSLPTAFPSNTPPAVNAPVEASSNNESGSERVSSVDGMPQVFVPEGRGKNISSTDKIEIELAVPESGRAVIKRAQLGDKLLYKWRWI